MLAGDLGTIKTASGVVLNKPRNLEIYEYIAKIHPTDRWKMLAASSKLYRPIKMTDPNGVVHMFISIVECSKYLGAGATTVQYNLTSKHGQANRKGYIFEYYV